MNKVKTFNFSRVALSIGAVALLAACGGSQPPIGAPGAMPQASAHAASINSANYKVVYSFEAPPDGNGPLAGVIGRDDTFYGTTFGGGTECRRRGGCGTVFSLTTGGAQKVLHSFGKGSDGAHPYAGLISVNGTFYGTTAAGGAYGKGTVFSITRSGTEKILHSFGKGTDGSYPVARLIDLNGTLYGTTSQGGAYACGPAITSDQARASYTSSTCGAVFSVTTRGKERVLHSFGKGTDGDDPLAGLVDVKGTLYGTTSNGGRYTCYSSLMHCGTVFSITTSGKEKVLYSFGKHSGDGFAPYAGLIGVVGTLYGTTFSGGAYCTGSAARGMLYSLEALTTFGHADIYLAPRWQFLGALEALNGVILIGLSTAYIFSVLHSAELHNAKTE